MDILPDINLSHENLAERPKHVKHKDEYKLAALQKQEFKLMKCQREYEKLIADSAKDSKTTSSKPRPVTARTALSSMKCFTKQTHRPTSSLFSAAATTDRMVNAHFISSGHIVRV